MYRPKSWLCLALPAIVGTLVVVSPTSIRADNLPCVSSVEAQAFALRHLQSRFMVAALACNQQDAYNKFVTRFRPDLKKAGAVFLNYFDRIGRGAPAVNEHVTNLANAAGLRRAEDPPSYCTETWTLFWTLEEMPRSLNGVAAANPIPSVERPPVCQSPESQEEAATTPPSRGTAIISK